MVRTIGEVAATVGVTVRTLHHYDRVGLLTPSGRSPAGYRLYDAADVARLQRIVAYRRLGLSLDDVAAILDDPAATATEHLRNQRIQLTAEIARLQAAVDAVDAALEVPIMELNLTAEEKAEIFDDFLPEEYEAEARERWGDTPQWAQSVERTGSYDADAWRRITAEADTISDQLAAVMAEGAPADGEAAMDLAAAHRAHISRWYYECSTAIHRGLGQMYVDDERFTAHYDRVAPGLAAYLSAAIAADCDRVEAAS